MDRARRGLEADILGGPIPGVEAGTVVEGYPGPAAELGEWQIQFLLPYLQLLRAVAA